MTDVSKMKQLQEEMATKRSNILGAVAAARDQVEALQRELNTKNSDRERLQARCNRIMAEDRGEDPPLHEFALAVLHADEVANRLIEADKILAEAISVQETQLKQLESDEIALRRKIHEQELAAKVIEFEVAVQRARLGQLSDEIRKLARMANVQLEHHSPLITPDYVLVAGYPIKAWEGLPLQITKVDQDTRMPQTAAAAG